MDNRELKSVYKLLATKNGYKEIPPSIIEFISNDYYLGKQFKGGKSIYNFWIERLMKIYPTPFFELDIRQNDNTEIIALNSSIGSGKCNYYNQEIEFYLSEDDIKKYNLEEYITE